MSPEQREYSTFLDGVLGQEARFVKGALELISWPGSIVSASRREGGVPRLLHTDMVDLDPEIIDQYVPLPPKGDAFAGVVVQAHRFWRRPLPDGQVGIRIRGVGKETAQLVMVDRPLSMAKVDIPDEQGLKAQWGVVIDRGRAADFVSGVLDQIRAQVTSR